MNRKNILSLSAIALASILLVSGFGLSSASAQTNKQITVQAKIPTNIDNKYSVIFKVCAGDNVMRAPEVIMTSDSATKNVKMNKSIAANTCKTTGATIDAFDKNTIKVKKVDKSKLNKMITSAETNLATIKGENFYNK